jgi:tetratricopeptide (TPR) repeat protein
LILLELVAKPIFPQVIDLVVNTSNSSTRPSLRSVGLALAACGAASPSAVILCRSLNTWIARKDKQGEGTTNADLAQRCLWLSQPGEALPLAQRAWELAHVLRVERDFIRAARLHGEAALGLGDLSTATERLHHALTRARTVNLVEDELPALTALAELHRQQQQYDTARELLEQVWAPAERGPYPLIHADALNVLAQLERDQGRREAAVAAATEAYRQAWCDGPPYAYHFGLSNARRHLRELGAPEPELPPFDASKYEPMPEVELDPEDEFHVGPIAEA